MRARAYLVGAVDLADAGAERLGRIPGVELRQLRDPDQVEAPVARHVQAEGCLPAHGLVRRDGLEWAVLRASSLDLCAESRRRRLHRQGAEPDRTTRVDDEP